MHVGLLVMLPWAFLDIFSAPPPPSPVGTDMSAVFAKYTTCTSCVGDGYGWCTIKRKCGGFANKQCGIGPQYVSEHAAARETRNGLWEPKSKRGNAGATKASPTP